jgi:N-acyl homoserine lactone hydrolase
MTRCSTFRRWRVLLLTAYATLSGAAIAQQKSQGVERLYVLQCGESKTPDVSANWSPGAHQGESWEFSDNCYLIRHAKGWFLWDAGMSDAIADKPQGQVAANGLLTLFVRKTLASQLRELKVAPDDIQHVAFSHFHADHVGNANLFSAATLYLQASEYAAAFGPEPSKFGYQPALYDQLRNNPVKKLGGDFDVFGDGSIVILSTPGHTPGHQSLLVRLPKRGALILTGDLVHFADNWENKRVPLRNFDREQSAQSMQRIAQLQDEQHAELWINHDKAQSDRLPKAPEYIE